MPKFYNELTREIVDYPEEAAALFDVLKPVPSERSRTKEIEADESGAQYVVDVKPQDSNNNKNGKVNAK